MGVCGAGHRPSGILYGTTRIGGEFGSGTVFSLTPVEPGSNRFKHTILHNFGITEGSEPLGELIVDPAGALIGTTSAGGSFSRWARS